MFDAHDTQTNLVRDGYDPGAIDGVMGQRTFAALLALAGARRPEQVPLAPAIGQALVSWCDKGQINTPLRLAHFLAQAACETFAFTRLKESDGGDPHYFDRYEGNKGLGNTQPGDGALFCGRGLLDTTGRWNYTHLHDLTGIDCVNHPELLEQPPYAVQAAVAFWGSRSVNAAADADDLDRVTQLVNGGLNGLSDRQIYLRRLKGALAA